MILQALYEYYLRKAADPDGGIAPQGFQWVEIAFIVVIDREGRFVTLEDQRQGEGRERRGKKYLLPKAAQRSGSRSYMIVNLLWDHMGYVFGHPKSESSKDTELAGKQHDQWLECLRKWEQEFPGADAIRALSRFYSQDQLHSVRSHPLWGDCAKKNGANIIFRVDGDSEPIPCLDFAQEYVRRNPEAVSADTEDDEEPVGDEPRIMRCLITGELDVIARKHTKTPINKDNKSFVGIQKNSGYDSYGKSQAYNSPVSMKAEFAYTTALRQLLDKDSSNKVVIADTTTIFWSQKHSQLEADFQFFWNAKDDPDRSVEAVNGLLRSPYTGSAPADDQGKFFVLGLAPGGGSRIAIRFWHAEPIRELSTRIRQHFLDLEIITPSFDKGNSALFYLLVDITLQNKIENLPPNLAGDVMRAILTGGPYPANLLQQTIRRIRAEREREVKVKRTQAAILKAYLNRRQRLRNDQSEEELTVALDPTNANSGYRLGRLFAALEKIQEDAQGNLNATIRDRYYGSASTSPVTVFPRLLKLKNHHLAKLESPALKTIHEKRLGEIIGGLQPEMPSHLSMEDQARFAVGYYHQRQAFFAKSDSQNNPSQNGA